MTRHLALSSFVLSLGCLVACTTTATGVRRPEAGEASAETPSPEGGAPSWLGLRLTAPLGAVREQHPQLTLSTEGQEDVVGELPLSMEGVALRTQLSFLEGRLAQVTASASDVSLSAYENIVRGLERELGPGRPSVCAHDGDIPFAEYIASGRGSISREWRDEHVFARISLSPMTTDALALHAHAMWLPLTERHPPDHDFKRARKQASRASACGEVGPSPGAFHQIPYGSSAADAARRLGEGAILDRDRITVPHRIGGVDGELTLSFWDDCMASVLFVAPGSVASYRSIQAVLLDELGTPERRERCSPTGADPTAEEIAAARGSFQTLFRDEQIRGSVRLSTIRPGEPQVVVDISFLPLARRAPRIDFAED